MISKSYSKFYSSEKYPCRSIRDRYNQRLKYVKVYQEKMLFNAYVTNMKKFYFTLAYMIYVTLFKNASSFTGNF